MFCFCIIVRSVLCRHSHALLARNKSPFMLIKRHFFCFFVFLFFLNEHRLCFRRSQLVHWPIIINVYVWESFTHCAETKMRLFFLWMKYFRFSMHSCLSLQGGLSEKKKLWNVEEEIVRTFEFILKMCFRRYS